MSPREDAGLLGALADGTDAGFAEGSGARLSAVAAGLALALAVANALRFAAFAEVAARGLRGFALVSPGAGWSGGRAGEFDADAMSVVVDGTASVLAVAVVDALGGGAWAADVPRMRHTPTPSSTTDSAAAAATRGQRWDRAPAVGCDTPVMVVCAAEGGGMLGSLRKTRGSSFSRVRARICATLPLISSVGASPEVALG